ncbi:unnamed protein product [Peniophora sp. CBMAI 1063]|nr:unnamed protein product [Peniophora sp. CBMAI 1063]
MNRQEWSFTLACWLVHRRDITGMSQDIERAISILFSIKDVSDKMQNRRLEVLGVCFSARSRDAGGDIGTLHVALAFFERAVATAPDSNPDELRRVTTNLCACLARRFQVLGDGADLQRAIMTMDQLAAVTSNDDYQLIESLRISSTLYMLGFRTFERLSDLENIMVNWRVAREIVSRDRQVAVHDSFLSQTAIFCASLALRFDYCRDVRDVKYLNEAINTLKRAAELTPDKHPRKLDILTQLGNCLNMRYGVWRTRGLDAPKGSPRSPMPVSVPHGAQKHVPEFLTGFVGASSDIEDALLAHKAAAALIPFPADERYPIILHNLAVCYESRYVWTGELSDLEDAISTLRHALDLPDTREAVNRAQDLTGIGILMVRRFRARGSIADLDEAIALQRAAAEVVSDSFHSTPIVIVHFHLSISLKIRFAQHRNLEDFDEILRCQLLITQKEIGSHPAVRLQLAQGFVQWLSENHDLLAKCSTFLHDNPGGLSTSDYVLISHSRLMHLLPEYVWIGLSLRARYGVSRKIGKLVTSAVSFAINHGYIQHALDWSESGRALIWSQVLSLRTPVDELARLHPVLAKSLCDIRDQLQQFQQEDILGLHSWNTSAVSGMNDLSTSNGREHYRRLVLRYEECIYQIRTMKGFERFLSPKPFSDTWRSLKQTQLTGLVIILNVGTPQCNALVFEFSPGKCNGHLRRIPLTKLTEERAHTLCSIYENSLKAYRASVRATAPYDQLRGSSHMIIRLLERIWTWIVEPILSAMDLMSEAPLNGRLPHVTWCPTGPLTQLPLHAAGIYDGSQQATRCVHDFVVSSYTPSISALLSCHQPIVEGCASPSILILTQPETPGQDPLPGTMDEGIRIREVLAEHPYTTLEHEQATVATTLAVLDQHPWVHFACHASQNVINPTRSAFELFDGPLTLSALMGKTSKNVELAFLSACQTATGDKNIPEESAHLAAGMLSVGFKGVVATMWSIKDEDGPVVVEAYYKELIALRKANVDGRGGTGAAYALHAAVKCLRDKIGEDSFERWVPYVHFGA